jgi:cytochrome b561
MALQTISPISTHPATAAPESRRTWFLTATSLVFIVLQSACTAVIALSGVRVAIGLGALAVATFGVHAPSVGFHQDAIRIPMMIAATIGSLINLYVIWRIRSLRARPSSQWRTPPANPSQRRSEFLQIALAVLTLILVATEWITHSMIHRVP